MSWFDYQDKSKSLYLSLDTCEEVPEDRGLAAGDVRLVMLMLVAGEGVLLRVHLDQSEAV